MRLSPAAADRRAASLSAGHHEDAGSTSALARIFRLFRLLGALFFPLFAIVPASADFPSPAQGLAL
jgi:hypothetical protein